METQELTPQAEPQIDWKAEAEKAKQETENLRSQYKGIQRELNKARQNYVSRDDLTALEDRLAAALETLRDRDEEEVERPKRQTPTEIIRAQRETKKEPQVDPTFAAAARQVTDLLTKMGVKQGSKEWEDTLMGDDGDYKDPFVVLEELQQKQIAQKAKELFEAKELEVAKKAKESGATKPDGVPSAAAPDDDEFIRDYAAGKSNDMARARKILGI